MEELAEGYIHHLLRQLIGPTLKRLELLFMDLGMQITDSEVLTEYGFDSLIDDAILGWAGQLASPMTAQYPSLVAKGVLAIAFDGDPPVDFWRTELGQVLVRLDAFPERAATKDEAAAVLMMSRTGVVKAAQRGSVQYDRHDNTKINRFSMLRFLKVRDKRARLAEEEKGEIE